MRRRPGPGGAVVRDGARGYVVIAWNGRGGETRDYVRGPRVEAEAVRERRSVELAEMKPC